MTATDIFKFVAVRPPQRIADDDRRALFAEHHGSSALYERIHGLEGAGAREAATQLARDHLASDQYAGLMKYLHTDFRKTLDHNVRTALEADSVEHARATFAAATDATIAHYLDGAGGTLEGDLWDALFANTIVPEQSPMDREDALDGIRDIHALRLLREDEPDPIHLEPAELDEVHATMPADLIPAADPPSRQESNKPAKKARSKLGRLAETLDATSAAIADIQRVDRLFRASQRTGAAAQLPRPEEERPIAITAEEFAANLRHLPEIEPGVFHLLSGLDKFVGKSPTTPWTSADFARQHLAPETLAVLDERRGRVEAQEPAEIIDALKLEMTSSTTKLLDSFSPLQHAALAQSKTLRAVLQHAPLHAPAPNFMWWMLPVPQPTAAARGIRPLGVGDLLIVRETLLKYQTGELAHIENVLRGEDKERTHRRLRRTEEIVTTETEEVDESEKDLQTTERFELHKETEKTIKSDIDFAAGMTLSASYGVVTLGAKADFASKTSMTDSAKSATTYAKDVTERSTAKILRRAREERTRKSLEEFEETNKHSLENKTGVENIAGLYSWVDKYYRARVHNYGRRLMFEFVVPEPAAFYLFSQSTAKLPGVTRTKPDEPLVVTGNGVRRLQPGDLAQDNYMGWVARYEVDGVNPYPSATLNVAMAFGESSGQKENTPIGKAYKELQVPAGYVATGWTGGWGWTSKDDNWNLGIQVMVTADGVEGVIPVSVEGAVASYAVNVLVSCVRKDETLHKWQLATYTSIMNSYQRALSDYNEQIAAASIQQGVAIAGRNPAVNRTIEREELEKAVLRQLTDEYAATRVGGAWRFNELFNAMQTGATGYPEANIDESLIEGEIIQFFEQAFEWQNLTYTLYPYFWGRKNRWLEVFPLDDPDPKFRDFLRAGVCRVVVPVHPAYEATILHYVATDEIWNGGQPPTLNDPLYISIVDDLRSKTDDDQGEVVGEWEIKLPTELVYLQQSTELPDYSNP